MITLRKQLLPIFVIFISLFSFNFFNVTAAPACDVRSGNPEDLIKCVSPDSLKAAGAPTEKARSLNEILSVINNVLAALAVFLSIIGAIVASINIAKSQGVKGALEEAKQMLTNCIIAFVISITVWLIVGLVLRTTGLN
jgi:hypothetical protein